MILAIDCDLRTCYGVTSGGWHGAATDLDKLFDRMDEDGVPEPDVLLFEIASPVSFNRGAAGHGAMTNLAKWALWNMAWGAKLNAMLAWVDQDHRLLVAPSNVWTKGYEEKARHKMCGAVRKKKDLRECEAMIWFYKHDPKAWKTLPDYLAGLLA
jgi:hypothetical protein